MGHNLLIDTVPILLLKTKSSPIDGYEEYFGSRENGQFEPQFVPVLEHHFNSSNLQTIKDELNSGKFNLSQRLPHEGGYGGLIFTSQRAVEAFHDIVQELRQKYNRDGSALAELLSDSLPLYVVGPATGKSIRAIDLPNPVVGEETGNGEVLAAFILEHYNRLPGSKFSDGTNRPLLFMVGEQRRDIIPKTLQSDALDASTKIAVVETTVYETGVVESFPDQFKAALGLALARKSVLWVVVFSPTGCKAMLECLGMLDPITGKAITREPHRKVFVATIGPTTRNYLQREFDFQPDVCAESPSPQGIGCAIATFRAAQKQD